MTDLTENEKLPPGLRRPWTWIKPKGIDDIICHRWLRAGSRVGNHMVMEWKQELGRYESLPQETGMDAAIDAARKP